MYGIGFVINREHANTTLRLTTAVIGTTGIEDELAIVLLIVGNMAVPEDDDTGIGKFASRYAGMCF